MRYSRLRQCCRVAAILLAPLMTGPVFAQSDPFQSNPGPPPAPMAPKPPSRAIRPPAEPEPAVSAPQPPVPAPSAPFNGSYKGGAPPVANCVQTIEEVDVFDSVVQGIGYDNGGDNQRWRIQGTVAADGSFSGTHARSVLTGRFQDGTFDGSYLSASPRCGRRPLHLQRTTGRQ